MDSEDKKLAPASAVFRVYWAHAKKYPRTLALTGLSAITLQAAMLAGPLYMRNFFNLLAKNSPSEEIYNQLVHILVFVVGVWLLDWASRRLQEWAVMHFETHTMEDLSRNAFGYLLDHSHNFFISNFAGSLTHKVNKFARSFERLADAIALQFFPTILFVSGAIVVLYLRQPILGVALLIWTLLFVWFQIAVARWRQPIRTATAEADTRVTATLADAISNQSTITLFSGETFERTRAADVLAIWRKLTARLWIADGWIWSGIGLFMIAIEGGLIYGGLHYWRLGLLTIGDFVLIQAYLITTFDRLVAINRELRGFYSALAEGGEMVAILETPHDIQDVPSAKELVVSVGEIRFDDVSFDFHKGTSVLQDLHLIIQGGERLALVGPSGAGKSTITKLLLRLYDLSQGQIRIDGQDISAVTQNSLRNAISFVPQEPVLFHRSLMENIRYGKRDATDEEVLDAARRAHCHEFISRLPQKYDTLVGERGVKLSGGERQRVAIARAILKNSPILILDEATSSLDSESESYIQDALQTLMKNKTVIVIAHRLSTIMKMDRIVVIEGGTIAATGTHNDLLSQGGLYKKLWSIQAGGFIIDEDAATATSDLGQTVTEEDEA